MHCQLDARRKRGTILIKLENLAVEIDNEFENMDVSDEVMNELTTHHSATKQAKNCIITPSTHIGYVMVNIASVL